MPQIKLPRRKLPQSYMLKEATKAMGAAQIILGLIHNALGTLWIFLYRLEEKNYSVGTVFMILVIAYMFVSGLFIVLAIVMNTISIFVAIIGVIIYGVVFPAFESIGTEYIWSNMAGMMLLQISIAYIISELVIAATVVHWFRKAFHHPISWVESSLSSEALSETASPHESERLSEGFKP